MAGRVNLQTGSYVVTVNDNNRLVVFDSSSAVTATLPQPYAAPGIDAWTTLWVSNIGAGTLTLSPSSCTIDGQATLQLAQFEGAVLFNDGTNWFSCGAGTGSGYGGFGDAFGSSFGS